MIENISKEGDFMKDNISVSILNSKNPQTFLNDIKRVEKQLLDLNLKVNVFDILIHFDIMDGKFVQNLGLDLKSIILAKQLSLFADVHLMVENPLDDGYIDKAIEYGADSITIHYEIPNFEKVLKYLTETKKTLKSKYNRDILIGVSIKPQTPINVLKKYVSKIDKILLMSVEPGKGGQKYIKKVNDKITFINNSFKNINVQVDGGVNIDTICVPLRKKVNSLVIGSFLTSSLNYEELYSKFIILNAIYTIENSPRRANLKLETTTLQVVPGGYGQDDILLGINVPDIRKCANIWYKFINESQIDYFIRSKYHDYRRFAVFSIINKVSILYKTVVKDKKNKQNLKKINNLFDFFESHIKYINNWDLTDVAGPNILAYNLFILSPKLRKKKIYKYLNDKNFWIKRIGIVSMLAFVRGNDCSLAIDVCDYTLYEDFHLFQKATGWVLREIYKKEPDFVVDYLAKKNKVKKLPSILLSYACEKMTIQEKEKVRNEISEA